MAIAKRPKRNLSDTKSADHEKKAEAFIAGAGKATSEDGGSQKKPILVRVDPELLARLDHAAKRLGISRASFMVMSSVKELERLEE